VKTLPWLGTPSRRLEPRLADCTTKGCPLSELPDVMEELLVGALRCRLEAGRRLRAGWLARLPFVETPITCEDGVACTPETKPVEGRLAGPGVCAALALGCSGCRRSSVVPLEGLVGRRSNREPCRSMATDRRPGPRLDAAAALRLLDGLVEGGLQGSRPLLQVIGSAPRSRPGGRLRQAWPPMGRCGRPGCLPLLGHRAHPADLGCLFEPGRWVPQPLGACPSGGPLRGGLAVGLSSWPLPALRALLRQCVRGLQPSLAAPALDLWPVAPAPAGARGLAPAALEPFVQRRRQRRLAALAGQSLCPVVHGRSWWAVPARVEVLRGRSYKACVARPVLLQALNGQRACPFPNRSRQAAVGPAPEPDCTAAACLAVTSAASGRRWPPLGVAAAQ